MESAGGLSRLFCHLHFLKTNLQPNISFTYPTNSGFSTSPERCYLFALLSLSLTLASYARSAGPSSSDQLNPNQLSVRHRLRNMLFAHLLSIHPYHLGDARRRIEYIDHPKRSIDFSDKQHCCGTRMLNGPLLLREQHPQPASSLLPECATELY